MNSASRLSFHFKIRVAFLALLVVAILGFVAASAHLDGTAWLLVRSVALAAGIIGFLLADRSALRVSRFLAGLAEEIRAIAAGDFYADASRQIPVKDFAEIAEPLDALRRSVGQMVAAVAEGSAALHRDGDELMRAGKEAWDRTARQSERIGQIATTMQEMSSSIAEVSSHTVAAANQARQAALAAREGGDSVEAMRAGMGAISESVAQSAESVDQLGRQSEQIARIVNVIEEIAEKTNLLALNAAIEASRAGEQGRGFAVVAGEVRRLAESTRAATTEIGQIVEGITTRTQEAIHSMHAGADRVTQGIEIVNRTSSSLDRIVAAANEVESTIGQIAAAATEQSAAAQEFSRNMDTLNRLGEEHAAASPVTKGWVESVRTDAHRLEESIERFQGRGRSPATGSSLPRAA